MNLAVSAIFEDRPRQWGLRGDPYLWEDMQRHFDAHLLPYPKERFIHDFHHFFLAACGKNLGCETMTHVPRYAVASGMSRGMVSHVFWKEKALALLLKRLDTLNKNHSK